MRPIESSEVSQTSVVSGISKLNFGSSPKRDFAIAALMVASLSAVMLFNEFHAYNSDAGGNYAQVRAMMDWGISGRSAGSPNLASELVFYPPVSHWLGAELGKLLGSGLRGMTVLAFVSAPMMSCMWDG